MHATWSVLAHNIGQADIFRMPHWVLLLHWLPLPECLGLGVRAAKNRRGGYCFSHLLRGWSSSLGHRRLFSA
eukprot:scaffold101002_cov20-Tisochrysis_lutea.AAC.1